jgi:hypothetical protein
MQIIMTTRLGPCRATSGTGVDDSHHPTWKFQALSLQMDVAKVVLVNDSEAMR